jgi:hypothetical protein
MNIYMFLFSENTVIASFGRQLSVRQRLPDDDQSIGMTQRSVTSREGVMRWKGTNNEAPPPQAETLPNDSSNSGRYEFRVSGHAPKSPRNAPPDRGFTLHTLAPRMAQGLGRWAAGHGAPSPHAPGSRPLARGERLRPAARGVRVPYLSGRAAPAAGKLSGLPSGTQGEPAC